MSKSKGKTRGLPAAKQIQVGPAVECLLGYRTAGPTALPHDLWQSSGNRSTSNLLHALEDSVPASLPADRDDGLLIVAAATTFLSGKLPGLSAKVALEEGLAENLPRLVSQARGAAVTLAEIDDVEHGRLNVEGLFLPLAALASWLNPRDRQRRTGLPLSFSGAERQQLWQARLRNVNFNRLRRSIVEVFGDGLQQDAEEKQPIGGLATEFRQALDRCLGKLPGNCTTDLDVMETLLHEFRRSLATHLQPVLNKHLSSLSSDSLAEKQAIATWVNERLQQLGLAIQCPKTGEPAILVADERKDRPNLTRFRLDARKPSGGRVRTVAWKSLPELQIVEDKARIEPFAKWVNRSRQSRGASGPGSPGFGPT